VGIGLSTAAAAAATCDLAPAQAVDSMMVSEALKLARDDKVNSVLSSKRGSLNL
jgi:hypothetical protein